MAHSLEAGIKLRDALQTAIMEQGSNFDMSRLLQLCLDIHRSVLLIPEYQAKWPSQQAGTVTQPTRPPPPPSPPQPYKAGRKRFRNSEAKREKNRIRRDTWEQGYAFNPSGLSEEGMDEYRKLIKAPSYVAKWGPKPLSTTASASNASLHNAQRPMPSLSPCSTVNSPAFETTAPPQTAFDMSGRPNSFSTQDARFTFTPMLLHDNEDTNIHGDSSRPDAMHGSSMLASRPLQTKPRIKDMMKAE